MDVGAWLRGLGLERYEQAFRDAEITPEPAGADRRGPAGARAPLGPRKAVLKAIRGLAGQPATAAPAEAARAVTGPASPPSRPRPSGASSR